MRVAISGSIVLALLQAAAAQTFALHGRVIGEATTTPVAHASIVVAKVGGPVEAYRTATADDAGRFTVSGLTPGSYRIYAQHDGYLQAEFGKTRAAASGVPVDVTSPAGTGELVITMTPAGTIAGHVFDRGDPVRNAVVRALKATYFDGRRALLTSQYAFTDDRGEYRLWGLTPGRYFVSATPRARARIEGDKIVTPTIPSIANNNQGQLSAPFSADSAVAEMFDADISPSVYYPSSSTAIDATSLDVAPGAAVAGIDLVLVHVSGFHVKGHVDVLPIGSGRAVTIGLSMPDGTSRSLPSSQTSDGDFDLPGVPPGNYVLLARTTAQPARTTVRAIEITDRDVTNVAVVISPAVTVTGKLTIDGALPPAGGTPILFQLLSTQPAPGSSAIPVQGDGSFAVQNVMPGDYRFRLLQPGRQPWIRSARWGSTDVTNAPVHVESDVAGRALEIVIGRNTASVEIVVVDSNRRPVFGALVIAVPDAARRHRSSLFRTATTDANGRARIDEIDPGEYALFATVDIEAAAWQDPDVLRRYENRGERIRLAEGGTHAATLQVLR